MNDMSTFAEKSIRLSTACAERLERLAQAHQTSEAQIIEKALTILFQLTDLFDESAERQGWTLLSEVSLQRVWDNELEMP